MPTGLAVCMLAPVIHPLPAALQPGSGSSNVSVRGKFAWRGVKGGSVATVLVGG